MSNLPIESDPTSTQVFGAIPVDVTPTPEVRPAPLSAQDQAAVAALPPGTALLIASQGGVTGARFLLDSETITVGRHPKSAIFLDDVTVSRKHAVFFRTQGGYGVRDSGSLNGTYVNRERVDEAVLRAGDEVQIGKFRMIFEPANS